MSKWKSFLRAFFYDFKNRMSGGASLLFWFLGAVLPNRWLERIGLAKWYFWIAAAVCLVLAAFRVWNSQDENIEKLKKDIAVLKEPLSEERARTFQERLKDLKVYEQIVLHSLVVAGLLWLVDAKTLLCEQGHEYEGDVLLDIANKTRFIKVGFEGFYDMVPEWKPLLEQWARTFYAEPKPPSFL